MIEFDDFARVDMRVGRILEAEPFPEARKPSYRLRIDFGPEIGERVSSAQLTATYPDRSALVGRQVVAVLNFPPRRSRLRVGGAGARSDGRGRGGLPPRAGSGVRGGTAHRVIRRRG
jgi:export-related chaperone CsaA